MGCGKSKDGTAHMQMLELQEAAILKEEALREEKQRRRMDKKDFQRQLAALTEELATVRKEREVVEEEELHELDDALADIDELQARALSAKKKEVHMDAPRTTPDNEASELRARVAALEAARSADLETHREELAAARDHVNTKTFLLTEQVKAAHHLRETELASRAEEFVAKLLASSHKYSALEAEVGRLNLALEDASRESRALRSRLDKANSHAASNAQQIGRALEQERLALEREANSHVDFAQPVGRHDNPSLSAKWSVMTIRLQA